MDIAVSWLQGNIRGDWSVGVGDLAIDPGGLRSAVLLSLFTDGLAPDTYVPPPGTPLDRRGWWGDSFNDYNIGSLLWTLDRTKIVSDLDITNEVQRICTDALQWLIDLAVVDSISVVAFIQQPGIVGVNVQLFQPVSPPEVFNFAWAWVGS